MQSLDGIIETVAEHAFLVWAATPLAFQLDVAAFPLPVQVQLPAGLSWSDFEHPNDLKLTFLHGKVPDLVVRIFPLHRPDQFGLVLLQDGLTDSMEDWVQTAHTDALTSLGNRRAFERMLKQRMKSMRPFALVMMDLNRLKHINDTRGHAAGDQFIQEVAQQLLLHLRSSDQAYRIGGDEFAVVLQDLEPAQVHIVLNRMQKVRQAVEDHTLGVGSFSAGVAFHPQESRHDLKLLVQLADERMYLSKQQQKASLPGNVTSINRRAVFESMSTTLNLLHSGEPPGPKYWKMMLEFAIQMVPSAQAGSLDLWHGTDFVRIAQVGYGETVLGVSYPREHQLEWYGGPEELWRAGLPRILRGNQNIASVSIETTGWEGDGTPVFNRDSRVGDICCNINTPIVFDGVVYGHLNLDNFVSEHAFQEDSRLAAAEIMKHYATVCQLLGLPGCGKEPSAVSGQQSAL